MSVLYTSNLLFQSNTIPTVALVAGNKLWCAFNASTGTPVISNSYSTSSILDVAVGRYRVKIDSLTLGNTSTLITSSSTFARDVNSLVANAGYQASVGSNSEIWVGCYVPSPGFVDPIYVSAIGSYTRILK